MAALNTKCRTNFNEWLENIPDQDLEPFVFSVRASVYSFGSDDFKLVNKGLSTGEPVGCHMIEARVNGNTKDKQLIMLFKNKNSGSVANDPSRLAFALIQKSVARSCVAKHIRQALQESPVEGESIVNKIHVQWDPAIKLVDGEPEPGFSTDPSIAPFVYEKIPFAGYDVDGKKIGKKAARKAKNGKK